MEIENWPIDRPKDYPLNARRWTPRAIAKVADSLRRFGWRQPIVVDSADVIVIGHLRRTAARSIGFAECPVHIARDLSPEQIRALRLADNRTNEEAAWDESLLSAEFQQLQEMSFDLSATGFDMPEIAKFLGEASPAGDQSAPSVGALEFRVIVDCSGEAQQAELLSRFERRGPRMPSIDLVVETAVSRSARARQLEAMFDVPPAEKCRLSWTGALPIGADYPGDWNVGLIVGPSGSGKTSIARHVFGDAYHPPMSWAGASVIDDFAQSLSMEQISSGCQAVGFNTIPAWLRPYTVLSNGEKFRVELARRLLELPDPIVVDEFSSVVDRQVAQIGAHAVQKFARKHARKFVALSCHYDIVEWLQPDWIVEPATMHFARRGLQRRPSIEIRISRVPYDAWKLFAKFHYLTGDLHRAARCFVLFVGDRPASFGAMLHRPHPKVRDIMGLSRLVTLPDWQGLGLAMVLSDKLGSGYKAIGKRMHTYPAHPSLIRSFDHSRNWKMEKRAGVFSPPTSTQRVARPETGGVGFGKHNMGKASRPCAVFEYCGEADAQAAELLQ